MKESLVPIEQIYGDWETDNLEDQAADRDYETLDDVRHSQESTRGVVEDYRRRARERTEESERTRLSGLAISELEAEYREMETCWKQLETNRYKLGKRIEKNHNGQWFSLAWPIFNTNMAGSRGNSTISLPAAGSSTKSSRRVMLLPSNRNIARS